MKKLIIIFFFAICKTTSFACDVCDRNQPKLLQGIAHGSGPDSNWDYVGIGITAFFVVFTLVFSIKWLIKPNENNTNHIKYSILK